MPASSGCCSPCPAEAARRSCACSLRRLPSPRSAPCIFRHSCRPASRRDIWWNIAPDCDLLLPVGWRIGVQAMAITRRRLLAASAGVAAALLVAAPRTPAEAQGSDVLVFAAASLKNALDAVAVQWTKATGKRAVISYASSPALAKQIE